LEKAVIHSPERACQFLTLVKNLQKAYFSQEDATEQLTRLGSQKHESIAPALDLYEAQPMERSVELHSVA